MKRLLNLGLLLLSGGLAAAPLIRNFHPEKTPSALVTHDLAASIREVVIPRLSSPSPDSDKGWENAYSFDQFSIIGSKAAAKARGLQASGEWQQFLKIASKPVNPTRIRLGFDDKYLYIKATCYEKQMKLTMADPNIQRDSRIYSYDNLDLMLAPNRNLTTYYQLSFDMNGKSYDAVCKKEKEKFVSDLSWNPDFKVWTARKDDCWEFFLALPFKEFAPEAREGGFIEMNINRMALPGKEFSSWNQVDRSFHEIDRMVRVHLGRKSAAGGAKLTKIVHRELKIGVNRFNLTLVDSNNADKLVISSRGADRQTRTFKPAAKQRISWTFRKPGKSELEFALETNGKRVDSTAFSVELEPPLTVKLRNTEIPAGNSLIPGIVFCRILPLQGIDIRFTLGKRTQTLKVDSEKSAFELDASGIVGKVPLQVELLRNGKPIPNASVTLQLTGNDDPFAED